jgi:hypothetical protein
LQVVKCVIIQWKRGDGSTHAKQSE